MVVVLINDSIKLWFSYLHADSMANSLLNGTVQLEARYP